MLSISESTTDLVEIREIPFVHSRRKRSLKLLEDVAGDGFYIDLTDSKSRVFYEMLEDPYPTYYGTLDQFLTFIAKVHAAGIVTIDGQGMTSFPYDVYDRIENEYLKSLK